MTPHFKDEELQAKVGFKLNLSQIQRLDQDQDVIPQPPHRPPGSCSLHSCADQRAQAPAAALSQPAISCQLKGHGSTSS